MKFCDKLQKRRKEKNMSQEQLADRCGVSRQAVSKWESGRSYPDMDKIMLLCDILDCNIYDLIDDVASGNTTSSKAKKMNIGNYLQEFLSFITKTVNMFWSMRLREKIKCVLEIIIMIILITSILEYFIPLSTMKLYALYQVYYPIPYKILLMPSLHVLI